MARKAIQKHFHLFEPHGSHDQVPFTGNIYSDLRVFILKNMKKEEAEQCLNVLQKYSLLELFENTFNLLREISLKTPSELPRNIAELVPGLLSGVLFRLQSVKDSAEKALVQEMAIRLGKVMLIAFVNGNRKFAKEILFRIAQVLENNSRQFNLGVKKVMQYFEKEKADMQHWLLDAKIPGKRKKRSLNNIYFVWNEHGGLPNLIDQLKNENYIKRRKPFFDLFEDPHSYSIIQWNRKRRHNLARLLHQLFEKEYCYVRGGKGFFTYAELRFADFNLRPFPRGSFRRLSYNIKTRPEQYSDVIDSVDELLNNL